LDPPQPGEHATEEQKLLSISIRFDPYSSNADEEYEAVKEAIEQIDILGILGREVAKQSIDPPSHAKP